MRKKYYEDPKENAAFERCVDVMTELILVERRIGSGADDTLIAAG